MRGRSKTFIWLLDVLWKGVLATLWFRQVQPPHVSAGSTSARWVRQAQGLQSGFDRLNHRTGREGGVSLDGEGDGEGEAVGVYYCQGVAAFGRI